MANEKKVPEPKSNPKGRPKAAKPKSKGKKPGPLPREDVKAKRAEAKKRKEDKANGIEPEKVYNRIGPPIKYEEWMPEMLMLIAGEGGHVAQMCVNLQICKHTFYRWTTEYPEFGAAYDQSRLISQAFYEKLLLQGAKGEIKVNFNSIAMILNNKFGDEYKRSAAGSNTEINITNNRIEAMPMDELTKKIAAAQKKLGILVEHDNDE